MLLGGAAMAVAFAVASTVVHADDETGQRPAADRQSEPAPEPAGEPEPDKTPETETASKPETEVTPEATPAPAAPVETAPAPPAEPKPEPEPEPETKLVPLAAVHAGSPDDPFTWAGQDALRSEGIGRQHTPSPEIFPSQALPFRFSHRVHLAEDLDCTDCHDMVTSSMRSRDVNLPLEETCFDCHDTNDGMADPDESDPPAACNVCHPGYVADFPEGFDEFDDTRHVQTGPPAWDIPPPNLKFNHKVHVDNGYACKTCHGEMTDVDLATRDNALPTMGTCLECHDGRKAPDACRTCHLTLPDGRIDTMASGVPLKPAGWYMADAHDESFLQDHRKAAQMNDGYCANCHQPKFCMDCHNGVQKPLKFHPNNWVLQHPSAARKNTPDCNSCHRLQTFCVDCHQQSMVAWEPGIGAPTYGGQGQADLVERRIQFHPEGWADFGRGPNHHAFQAQRNIRACASCHTEQTCLDCHSLQGRYKAGAPNPHPPGFAGSNLCQGMVKRNHRSCVKCHTDTSCSPR